MKRVEKSVWESIGFFNHIEDEDVKNKMVNIFNDITAREPGLKGKESVTLFPIVMNIANILIKEEKTELIDEINAESVIGDSRNKLEEFKLKTDKDESSDSFEAECCYYVALSIAESIMKK
mgnify:CR=1 FL=1